MYVFHWIRQHAELKNNWRRITKDQNSCKSLVPLRLCLAKHIAYHWELFKIPIWELNEEFPHEIPFLGYFWEVVNPQDLINGFFWGKRLCRSWYPNIEKMLWLLPQLNPKVGNNMGIFCNVSPKVVNKMEKFPKVIPKVVNAMGILLK